MTEEQLNKFFDGITAHNKDMLDRERDAIKRTVEFLGLTLIKEDNKVSMQSLLKLYPEDSSFNDCGTFVESDVFFKKINDSGIEPELMDYLKKYLTGSELKDRLTEDNFMSNIKVPELIKIWQKNVKLKELKREINEKEQDLISLKIKLGYIDSSHVEKPKDNFFANVDFVHEGH